jgi:hypothetical protein
MLFLKMKNKVSLSLMAVLLLGTAFVGIWNVSAVRVDKEQFYERLRDGAGKEITIAKPGDSFQAVQASVDSLSNFVEYRSGLVLSKSSKERLAKLEAETLAGQRKYLTAADLSDIMLEVLFERATSATSEEIERAANTLRGFEHPDLPEEYKNGRKFVMLRANMPTKTTVAELVNHINKIKNSDDQSKLIYRSMASRLIGEQVAGRATSLRNSMPEKYELATTNLSPVQVLLIAYSVAADDNLLDSATNLKHRMKAIQKWMEKKYKGKQYPASEQYKAYGPNGYLYSSPVDILFDEKTSLRFLDKTQEKGEIK